LFWITRRPKEKTIRSAQTPDRRPRRSAWLAAGLMAGSLVVLGGALLWIYRISILTATATSILERQGLGPVHVVFDRVGLRALHARDISLYGGGVQASGLALTYTPFQLLGRRFERVSITGLRVALATDGGDITLGGRPLGRSSASNAAPSAVGGIRIDALNIADAHIALDRPGGRVETNFTADLALAGTDLRNASFAVDITLPIRGKAYAVQIAIPDFSLSSQADGGLRLNFAKARIVPKDLPWAADDIDGDLIWKAGGATARIAINSLKNLQEPALIQPLKLSGEAALAGPHLDFTVNTEIEAAGDKGKLGMVVKGRHDRPSNSGSATVAGAPAVFRPNGAQPADYFPVLGDVLSDVAGSVAISGGLQWRGSSVAPNIAVRLTDVAVESEAAKITKLNGAIHFTGLSPLQTPPKQSLTGTIQAGGLPPSVATLEFQLLPKPALMVESTIFDFAGGRISASPFAIDPSQPVVDTTLQVARVDLAQIFALIGIDGLSGTGRLEGHIPLRYADGRVRVANGALTASGPGVLRFKSDALPKEISGAGQPVQLALDALTDFHYETLALELNQASSGEGTILLKLHGSNPAVLEGHPFAFNIKLESNFDRLTDLALRSMTAAQELLRRTVGTIR